ncbi:fibrinogen-like protein 1 [Anabas testudineus]|uniref:Fibrinogen C-terminal domain-containing protein n=1 Tax=Anabas testudineus TaxID=64144 RepID=A0A7N6FKX0_ANATE|nr:fibrinogen-like protein 1 [Anabas testudineus]
MRHLPGCCGIILVFLLGCAGQLKEEQQTITPRGTDCTQIKALSPQARSGVYLIQPPRVKRPFKVYCEMRADGGWTVFQKRSGGLVSFNKPWAEYKNGFGNLKEDHWLGLNKVYSLTKDRAKKWTMRIDLWDHHGSTAFAEYKNFRVGSEKTAYRLNVGKYRGNAGDAIRGAHEGIDQNHHGFSTADRDNDGCSPCIFGDIVESECAASEGGGWWYSRCGSASLNGDWHPAGNHMGWASGLHWHTWKTSEPYSVKATRMMIKSVEKSTFF